MPVRNILVFPNPILRRRCSPVEEIDSSVRELAEDLKASMNDKLGIGLAAPQIGEPVRMFVANTHVGDDPGSEVDYVARVFINPEITWQSDILVKREEGCLSFPEIYTQVTRPDKVTIRFLTTEGLEEEETFEGRQAQCVQHEIDHLNGVLFPDRMVDLQTLTFLEEYQSYWLDA